MVGLRTASRRGQLTTQLGLAIALAALILLILGYCAGGVFGSSKTTITSDVVVERVQDLERLISTKVNLRDVLVYQNTIHGHFTKKTLIVLKGYLLIGVDMKGNPPPQIDQGKRLITLNIPHAKVTDTVLVEPLTYDERSSIFNRFTPGDRDMLEKKAREQLGQAGDDTGLLQHADAGVAQFLRDLFKQDGYTVQIQYRA
ncbi:MAG: DUF4230 domain-containing protein [Gemmatimonadota bacterium]|nr:DUF4230 domain-containing protein [Gemmatimonadota bacterium]